MGTWRLGELVVFASSFISKTVLELFGSEIRKAIRIEYLTSVLLLPANRPSSCRY